MNVILSLCRTSEPVPSEEEDASNTRATTSATDRGMMVYIAAPFTEPDPVLNTHVVIKIADALLAADFVPVIPHLSLAWHLVSPKPYAVWLAYDRELLRRCDAILRIPGFSVGATQECRLAESLGIPVIHSRSVVPTACVAALMDYYSN